MVTKQDPADGPRSPGALDVTLVAAAVAVVYLAYRLLIISKGNVTTAVGLLDTAGAGRAVLGLLAGVLPTLVLPIAGAVFAWVRTNYDLGKVFYVLRDLLLMAAVFMSSLYMIVYVVVFIAYLTSRDRWTWIKRAGDWVIDDGSERFVGVVSGLVFLLFLNPTVWLSSEDVKIRGVVVTGYVVHDDGRWMTLLHERTRLLETVPSDQVEHRAFCEVGHGHVWSEPVFAVLFGTSHYPRCHGAE